jgi:hypothetical protein
VSADLWIRWSHRCNGWMWSVMRGADVLAEGSEPSERAAVQSGRAALAKVQP